MSEFERELRIIVEQKRIDDQSKLVDETKAEADRMKRYEGRRIRKLAELNEKFSRLSPIVKPLMADLANATWSKGKWGDCDFAPNAWQVGRVHYYGRKVSHLPILGQLDRWVDYWKPISKSVSDTNEVKYVDGLHFDLEYYAIHLKKTYNGWCYVVPRYQIDKTEGTTDDELKELLIRESQRGPISYTPHSRMRFG